MNVRAALKFSVVALLAALVPRGTVSASTSQVAGLKPAPQPVARPKLGSAARAFPDSRARILVFTDQLPGQMSEAQWKFAATHYVGTQKEATSWTRRMRTLNPAFLVLHYQLAVGNGPAPFRVGETWTNDFPMVTKHEGWFMHDAQGHRLHQKDWDWYVMDIRFRNGKPINAYPAYWVQSALDRMIINEDDGCFADSYTQDILMGQLQPASPLFSQADLNARDWLPNLNQFGAYCAAAFHRQPERFYYLPNLGGLVTSWDHVTNLLVGDGGMNEGFCASGPGNYFSDADWKLAMSRLLLLASHGKIILCQTGVDPANADYRWFLIGAFLLTKGPHSYLNMIHHSSLEWYPEYTLDLGRYKQAPQPDIQQYWDAAWGVYRRDYDRGIVLVNPSALPVSIPKLGASMTLISAEGGGAVPEGGRQPGSLSSHVVTSVTVPAHSARVLLSLAPNHSRSRSGRR